MRAKVFAEHVIQLKIQTICSGYVFFVNQAGVSSTKLARVSWHQGDMYSENVVGVLTDCTEKLNHMWYIASREENLQLGAFRVGDRLLCC